MEKVELSELTKAANFLEIKPLFELCCFQFSVWNLNNLNNPEAFYGFKSEITSDQIETAAVKWCDEIQKDYVKDAKDAQDSKMSL